MTHRSSAADWLQIQDRICVVTGAASGIGEAIVKELLAHHAKVVLIDRNQQALHDMLAGLQVASSRALAVQCDTSQESQLQAAALKVSEQWGAAHVVINNAGVLRAGALQALPLDDWNQVLSVNLSGYWLCAKAFAAQLQSHGKQGGASMVHVASIAAHFPQGHSGAYSAAKAGVRLLSQQLATEWGASGVRSNVICPGMIRTPLTTTFYAQPGVERARAAATASGRVGEPEDIAHVAAFLASPRSSYVNAAEIMVDGGMSSKLMDMVPRLGFSPSVGAQPLNGEMK